MFPNATVSSRSSSSRSGNSCGRNSSMPSLRMQQSPLAPKTSYNPLFRHTDAAALTSFDASQFVFLDKEQKRDRRISQRKHPILRRFNSHDSHANYKDFDDSNTPDSTNSRSDSRTTPETSPDNTGERGRHHEYEARDFLERFSLPRVVRVENGEPLLLYRCFDSFTKVQARGFIGKRGKERPDTNSLDFPEGYSGWFSLTNEKGEKSAIAHSSILQLVREQVCSFLSVQPFTAYAGHNPDPSEIPGKVQYLKTQVRGGQLFQLRAVFQHKERLEGGRHHSTKSSHVSRSARDKDLANRYAQLISQTNQEFYVPLTTKGEFYEVHSSMKARLCFQGLLDKTGPLALDKDCLYKITHLLRRVALPVKVKLLTGPVPPGLPKDFSDTFILERKVQEPLLVTCTLPSPSENIQHHISCINLNSGLRISRSMLGFDSENRLFKSQRLQAALAYCHKNVEAWYREVRIAPNLQQPPTHHNRPQIRRYNCIECRRYNKLCPDHDHKRYSEIEDHGQKQLITKEVIEKFPKSKKWYRHLIKLGKAETPLEKYLETEDGLDSVEKIKSIERYKDMSRLIEERFGKKSYNPVKKSASFMFSTKPINLEESPTDAKNSPALLKCQSLDTQLYTVDESKHQPLKPQVGRRNSKSSISDNISFDFQMCILENDNSMVEEKQLNLFKTEGQSLKELRSKHCSLTQIDLNEIKPVEEEVKPLKKSKPDLIPTLPKDDSNSYITERLCSEFHVKTKVQKRTVTKQNMLAERTRSSIRSIDMKTQSITIMDEVKGQHNANVKSVVAQVHHEVSKTKMLKKLKLPDVEDIPYSHVADEIKERPPEKKIPDENIYAEICENAKDTCDSKKICQCKRTKGNSEYCYVKLGSNGDSVTQSDSDEAIYNTLR